MDVVSIFITILTGIILGLIWRLYERIAIIEKQLIKINEDVKWIIKYLDDKNRDKNINGNSSN